MKLSIVVLVSVASLCLPASGAVIISQYYEGSSNNKWIELYNTSSTDVDLSAANYQLGLWSNGNREKWKDGTAPDNHLALSGVISGNGVYLLSHGSASKPNYATADQTSNGTINFNGNDSVVLYTGTTYSYANVVDAFGLTGETAKDTSFVRNADILSGTNSDFDSGEWTEFTIAQVDGASSSSSEYLGTHVVPEPSSLLPLFALTFLGLFQRRRPGKVLG